MYSKIRKIGDGMQGVCHLVKRNQDQKLLVLKTLKEPPSADTLPPEAKSLHDFLPSHRRLVQLKDFVEGPGGIQLSSNTALEEI